MRLRGKYRPNSGISLNRERLGSEPWFWSRDRLARLGSDNEGALGAGWALHEALVAGINQGAEV